MSTSLTRGFGGPLRYIQGPGELNKIQEYTEKYGDACIVIDGFLYESICEKLTKIFAGKETNFTAICFNGECCREEISRIQEKALDANAGVFVGIGGGKTLDTTKLCADEKGLPVIVVPTAASTDAPVSEIAVLYTKDGEYIGSKKLSRNSDLVLVDTEIILTAPKRLFAAGIGDALATYFEALACSNSDSPHYIGTNFKRSLAGMAIAEKCYEILLDDAEKAVQSLETEVITESFENVVEANILLSGLGFLNTGLAAAHGIHSGLTAIPETHTSLHGEKVAFGIICQLILENADLDFINEIVDFLISIDLPVTLKDLSVEPTRSNALIIAKKTCEGPLVFHEPFFVSETSVANAILAADRLGSIRKGVRE